MSQQVLVEKKERVAKIDVGEKLKLTLDSIDKDVKGAVVDGYKESRLKIELGMWDKGEAIIGVFRGVKTPPSWRELERKTGRDHKALKRWYDIFLGCCDREVYLPIARRKAEEWTKKFLLTSVVCLTQGVSDDLPGLQGEDRELEFLKCLVGHYNSKEGGEICLVHCSPCLKIGLCRQIVSVTEEFFKRWDKDHKGADNDSKISD